MAKNDLLRLKSIMLNSFDRNELSALCFEHFTDIYRRWGYETSTIKMETWILQLIDYCEQTHQTERLKQIIKQARPDTFEWEYMHHSADVKIIEIPIRIEFVCISKGPFLMGSNPAIDKFAKTDEQPQHKVWLSDYYISRYPITNAQYYKYIHASNQQPNRIIGWDDFPVTQVSWFDAQYFCAWLRECSGFHARLPTEAEWEKACRGEQGQIYPWGDAFEANCANVLDSRIFSTTNVNMHLERGSSPYGIADMSGNVHEWCLDWYDPEIYKHMERRSTVKNPTGPAEGRYRVLRGGSFKVNQYAARCAARDSSPPALKTNDIGFRIAFET